MSGAADAPDMVDGGFFVACLFGSFLFLFLKY